MIGQIFINGIPMNVWPQSHSQHLCDLTDVEDVDFEDISNQTMDDENEKAERHS